MVPLAKRRRIEATIVEEITFDTASRHEYLTGFHKRKLQRAKHAQEAAERRAKAEKIEQRKKVGRQRPVRLRVYLRQIYSYGKNERHISNSTCEKLMPC